ncbi:MAG: M48 family metallopeptidase [Bacteroidia bacterium]
MLEFTKGFKSRRGFYFIFILLSMLNLSLLAQTKAFIPLQAQGAIPQDFLLPPEVVWMKSVSDLSKQESKKVREIKQDFYFQQSFYLKSLLSSGNVIFGDTLSAYLTQVAHKILKNRPQLQGKLRFYTVRSSSPNAFTSNDGIILVNIGLLAKLKNEAQLAFVLCHEISHFEQQHPLKIFQETRQSHHRQGGVFEKLSMEERLFSQGTYTQQTEYQADSLGLQLYLSTGYATADIDDLFEKMESTQALYDSTIFDFSALNIQNLPFFNLQTQAIEGIVDEENNPSLSHPNAAQRKAKLAKLLPKKNRPTLAFIIEKSHFYYVQKLARMENSLIELENRHYETSLYNLTILAQLYPEEALFWQKMKTYCLYGLCKYINSGRLWEIHIDYQVAQKPLQLLCYYLEKGEPAYLLKIAFSHLKLTQQQNPDSKLWRKLGESLGEDVYKYYPDSVANFQKIYRFDNKTLEEISTLAKTPPKEKTQRQLVLQGINLGIDSIVFVNPTYQRFDYRKNPPEDFLGGQAMEFGLIEKIGNYAKSVKLTYHLLHNSNLTSAQIEHYNELALLHHWIKEKLIHPEGFQVISLHYDEIQKLIAKYKTPYFAWTGGVGMIQSRQEWKKKKILRWIPLPYFQFRPKHETFFYTLVYDMQAEKYLVKYPRRTHLSDQADMFHSVIYDIIYQLKKH